MATIDDLASVIETVVDDKISKTQKKTGSVIATVNSKDLDGTIWVTLDGGVEKTPITTVLADVQPGDVVAVRIENGRSYIDGNATSPAASGRSVDGVRETAEMAQETGDAAYTLASSALESAAIAKDAADSAIADAAIAREAAEDAAEDAASASSSASAAASAASTASAEAAAATTAAAAATTAAGNAQIAANAANFALSDVEKVVGTLEWIAEHGEYALTEDTAVVSGKVYYTRSGTNPDYVYTVVADPKTADIATYYELHMDESVQNYLATHLWMDMYGLNLSVDSANGYRIHQGTVDGTMPMGMYIVNGVGETIAMFGQDGIRLGKSGTYKTFVTEKALTIRDEYDAPVFDVGGVHRNEDVWIEEKLEVVISDIDNVPPIRISTYAMSANNPNKNIRGSAKIWGEFENEDINLGIDGEEAEGASAGVTTSWDWDIIFSINISTVGSTQGFDYSRGWWWKIEDNQYVYYTSLSFNDLETYPQVVRIYVIQMNNANGVRSMTYDPVDHTISIVVTDSKKQYFEETYGDSENDLVLYYTSTYWGSEADVPAIAYGASDWETDWPRSSYAEAAGSSPYSFKGAAPGFYSTDLGNSCRPSGPFSFVNGLKNESAGTGSHAEGNGTFAFGEASHAEGWSTEAIGNYSHSEGYLTRAVGLYSHAEGLNTVAKGRAQSVVGRYNVVDNDDEFAFLVGNGTLATPSNALAVALDGHVETGGLVDIQANLPEIDFTTPNTNYMSYIRSYDTNSAGAGHNMVIKTGGNLFLGGGESPAELYNLVVNGATDVPGLTSESPVIGADSWMYFFSNCNTIANRQRIAFGGADGILEIPGNLRLVNKTEMPTLYPNARARTALGYVYGDHVRLRSREYDMNNGASSRTAQVTNVPLDVTDENNSTFMRLTARQLTDGTVRGMLEVAGTHTGSTVWNAIYADVRKDGSQHYGVNNATNFRSDLGINNAANLTTGTLPSDRLPTVPIAKGGTGATTAAAARTNLGFTRANLAEKMHAVAIFSGLSVAKGGALGTNTAVFDYQFFMITSASNGYMLGYRTGSTSSSGGIRAIGGFDDGSTSYAYVCLLSVSTAGKVVNTCCSRHDLATQSGAALNITGLYGLR